MAATMSAVSLVKMKILIMAGFRFFPRLLCTIHPLICFHFVRDIPQRV